MSWERAVHFAGPVALLLISLRPLLRRRGHYPIDRRTAWLCLLGGVVWPFSVILRVVSGMPTEKIFEVLDAVSIFFGGVLFAYGFWSLRRVRFSLHTEGDNWATKYRNAENKLHGHSRLEGK